MEIEWLEIADSPESWKAVGFEVDSLRRCNVGGVEHRFIGSGPAGQRGIVGWAVSGIDEGVTDIDGIPTLVVPEVSRRNSHHPNHVSRIDHLVIRTPSTARTVEAFAALGLQPSGARESTALGEAVDMAFFWAGSTLLEVVGPPATKEPNVDKETNDRARLVGVAYVSQDLDSTAEILGPNCSTPKPAVQVGRRIAALRKKAGLSVPMAFMTPHRSPRKDE